MNSSIFWPLALGVLVIHGTPAPDVATTERLGGVTRALTHVSTDKPIYKPGETVFIRGVVLNAQSHTPSAGGVGLFTIKGGKGETLVSGQSPLVDGSLGTSWVIPPDAAGGTYTLEVRGGYGQAPGVRSFDVRVFRAPRLNSQIRFQRDGYAMGDTLVATLETKRAEGGVPTGARITATATIDDVAAASAPCVLDAQGRCTVSLPLPKRIERGEGVLAFVIDDSGIVETATKTIPLLVKSFDVAVYPEGGSLVAGLRTRVYFEGRTSAKKPADIAGQVVDSKGQSVARFRAEHDGRGRFELTPVAGERYTLRIEEPAGVDKLVTLPSVITEGGVLVAQADRVRAGEKVPVRIAWTGAIGAKVTLKQREVELDSVALEAKARQGTVVSLNPKKSTGVLIATLFDAAGVPLAERLVFVEPTERLSIELTSQGPTRPGAEVALKLRTSVGGKPVSAMVGLSVTDESVLELVDKREQAPALPAMVLLENDVKDLADAHVYLDPTNPKAAIATDLLLGTQGWRRFALMQLNEFLTREGDFAQRALAFMRSPMPVPSMVRNEMAGGPVRAMPVAPMPMAAARPAAKQVPQPDKAARLMPPPPPPAALLQRHVAAQPQAAPMVVAERRAAGAARMADKLAFAEEAEAPPANWVVVREFAHSVRPGRQPNDRIDFADTLYWAAAVRTDASGEATVRFGTSDAVTTFRASAGGYTAGGALGEATTKIESLKPFYVEPKLPLEVTEGDVIRLPIGVVNSMPNAASVKLSFAGIKGLTISPLTPLAVAAQSRARALVDLTVSPGVQAGELAISAQGNELSDEVTRPLRIAPKGFPSTISQGGLLMANGKARFVIEVPKDFVAGSGLADTTIYPSPAGNLTKALASMIREPSGCFEQTSSTTYPMTMALTYFKTHTGASSALIQDAKDKLERGYKRLVGYECKEKGFEWFGEDPAHEALTAYGLLQFTDMQQVRSVDERMLSDARAWLLKQRDGKGGFERKRRALHTWVESKDTSDAYITWSLLAAGQKGLGAEVARALEAGATAPNLYVTALAANVAAEAKDTTKLVSLGQRLAKAQDPKSGMIVGGTQSIVGSTGRSLAIETTALAVLAWLDAASGPSVTGNIEAAMKALAEASTDGSYGATQSTVLALKAVLAYDRARSKGRAPGSVQLMVDGKRVGSPLAYDGNTQTSLSFPDAAELLTPGQHTIELVQTNGGQLPYSFAYRFFRVQPDTSANAKVNLTLAMANRPAREGDVVEVRAKVSNRVDEPLSTVVAIVGVPGGLEPRVDQLKELVKAKAIDAYELMGRDVVLYWRGMTAKQVVEVPLQLVAQIPGTYTGPASRAYLYYGPEDKVWVAGLSIAITPKP